MDSKMSLAFELEESASRGDWERCAQAHIKSIPESLWNQINENDQRKLRRFEAVILELLPIKKRMIIENAVAKHLLSQAQIGRTNKTLVSEKVRDTLFGMLLRNSMLRIKDAIQNNERKYEY